MSSSVVHRRPLVVVVVIIVTVDVFVDIGVFTTSAAATTITRPCINICRYEQGLEDYEEAVARVDKTREDQQNQQTYALLNGLKTALSLIETATSVWNKVSNEYEQKRSTIDNKSNDRRTAHNDSVSNDQNGESRRIDYTLNKRKKRK